jgi:hypothetical protein
MRAWPQTDVSASLPAGLGLKKEGRIGARAGLNQTEPTSSSHAKRGDAPASCLLVSPPVFALGRYPLGGSLFPAALRMNAELAP